MTDIDVLDEPVGEGMAMQALDVCKKYGYGKTAVPALSNCDIAVKEGIIYGLLGPSGCGKTTLLRCVLGRLNVDSGHVLVQGKKPGVRGHGVPGSLVGYMPQELSLYGAMTIGETWNFFGLIHKMNYREIKERTEFLLDFLNLPSKTRLISQLSGGQQRRVSFGAALLHQPPLLVLDEPTVGVDPVLRQRIWGHLLEIVSMSKTTIIITTHYIEEARQADMVGLMRNGRLLAESPPGDLIEKYQLENLEAVFLRLCMTDVVNEEEEEEGPQFLNHVQKDYADEAKDREETESLLGGTGSHNEVHQYTNIPGIEKEKFSDKCLNVMSCPSFWNILALFLKSIHVLKRNVGFLLFSFILPSIQIILFILCIGNDPFGLPMAIWNNDTGGLAKLYLTHLDSKTIVQTPFRDPSQALETVKRGENWGAIFFNSSFSTDLVKRFLPDSNHTVSNATIAGSTIKLHLDMTNEQISLTIQRAIMTAFEDFAEGLLKIFHFNPATAELPIQIGDPVYGEKNPNFTTFMAPGIIISITFFMASGLTAVAFVSDRKEGLLERSFVSGVSPVELMVAHMWTQLFILLVQVGLLLIFTLLVFQVPCRGPVILVIILAVFQGFVGMALGLMISAICDDEKAAIQMALGSVYPSLLMSGIIWPLEGMPIWMRSVSRVLPMTYACESMRSLISRGWSIDNMTVARGFLVSIGWGWGLLALTAIILRIRG